MEENATPETSLWNKKQDEVTIGDAVKVQLYALAAFAAVYGVAVGGVIGYDKFSNWKSRKAAEKVLNIVDTTCTSQEVEA